MDLLVSVFRWLAFVVLILTGVSQASAAGCCECGTKASDSLVGASVESGAEGNAEWMVEPHAAAIPCPGLLRSSPSCHCCEKSGAVAQVVTAVILSERISVDRDPRTLKTVPAVPVDSWIATEQEVPANVILLPSSQVRSRLQVRLL